MSEVLSITNDTLQPGFETAQNLNAGFAESSCELGYP